MKKQTPKNLTISWMCIKCHNYKSDKSKQFINAITLKCSVCGEHLKYNYSNWGGREMQTAECPDGHTAILIPKCVSCGEGMVEFDGTVEDLTPIETESSVEMGVHLYNQKKPWWQF